MTLVKICGIRSVDTALAAAAAGADLLGFNFAPVSKRRTDVSIAADAIAALRATRSVSNSRTAPSCHPERSEGPESSITLRSLPAAAGIFVNQPLEEVAAIAGDAHLDYIQLSGDESPAYCASVTAATGLPVIKAVRLGRDSDFPLVEEYTGEGGVQLLLADASVAGSWGGSGAAWDWSAAAGLAARAPLLLAGGLTPENVAGAVAAVHPLGVDVASGVETAGWTDPDKVKTFILAVKRSQ